MLTANFIYNGLSDYFGGHGCRYNQTLLYAYYGSGTTLRNLIDQWVDDSCNGFASEYLPEVFSGYDVRKALLTMLTDLGRADYKAGALSEFAKDFTEADGDDDYESPVAIVLLTWEEQC